MRERAAKPRPVRRRDVYTEADGLFGRITDLVIENPVRSGGFVMVVMVIGTIISNAAYFQTTHHPAPFFVTRAANDAAAPMPKARVDAAPAPTQSQSQTQTHSAAAPAATIPPLPTAAPDSVTLVTDTQRALAELKLYDGPIDGKIGPQTRAALSSFEMRIGLVPTGQPSPGLLVQLKKALPRSSAATPAEIAPPALIPTSATSGGTPDVAASDPTATGSIDHAQSAARIRKVQTALNDIGYGPIRVDGKGGGDTEDAIRRFQLDNGLALTGEADDALMAKLVMIGAMKSI
ncbi:peptidoglycan-binding protein [Mesorhizobium sp. BR1-1-16]|uniref:peptidoglycan-binding domain-containing protein n=1 Tax=Mesorhizobium sp. BR1-1-16 TaxID=2876653 RepID=UPI001CCEB1C8|nr:peptidoglycan-binding domain-containing protein [Mesorhizobium sp. BR1-1-16]MBZ9934970.1 peptidoglycan-binding protein [Mesorhizobium sp. BR1-1-16]